MNIFSNIGITELVIILLLALIVVGPERLPEMGAKLGKALRDLRKMYENLTSDLGPELASFQETTRELRESVDSVRSIPQDMVSSVMEMTELQETVDDLKSVTGSIEQVGQTLKATQKAVTNPVGAAVHAARTALDPTSPKEAKEIAEEGTAVEETAAAETATVEVVAEAVAVEAAPAEAPKEEPGKPVGPGEESEATGDLLEAKEILDQSSEQIIEAAEEKVDEPS